MNKLVTVEEAFEKPWIRTTYKGVNVISVTKPWKGQHPYKVVASCAEYTMTMKCAGHMALTFQPVVGVDDGIVVSKVAI